ncbi:MAG: OmpA family protein [Endomicrobium sp.]|nr:OmpA family protein [Endomicrobium sp.]
MRNNSGGKNVVLQSKVLFDLSKSELTPKAAGALNEIAALLNLYKTNVLVVEGHADNTGEKKYNEKLSAARAKAVYDFLAENGIEKYRMKAVSYGYTKPLNDNLTESERAENRRAEIIIFKGE